MRGALGIFSVRLFSGESPRQWPSSLHRQQPPFHGLSLSHGKTGQPDKGSRPLLTQSLPIAQQQLHSILQNTEIVILNINSVFLLEGFYYLLHMRSVLGEIKLEPIDKKEEEEEEGGERGGEEEEEKRKEKEEKRKRRISRLMWGPLLTFTILCISTKSGFTELRNFSSMARYIGSPGAALCGKLNLVAPTWATSFQEGMKTGHENRQDPVRVTLPGSLYEPSNLSRPIGEAPTMAEF